MAFVKWFGGKREEYPVERKTVSVRPCQAVEDALPQPIEDKVIGDELFAIFERVEEHINQFYTPAAPFAATRLTKIDSRRDVYAESSRLPDYVQHEALNPKLQSLTLKFADEVALKLWMMEMLARLLVTAISPFDVEEDRGSLLPEELLDFLSAVEEPERLAHDAGYQSVFGHWRALSMYLLNHPSVKEENRRENERRYQKSYCSIIDEVDTLFDSLYDPNDEIRIKHLKQILRRTTEFGRLLWSQIAQYQFDWGMDPNQDNGLSMPTTATGRRRRRTREVDAKKRRSGTRSSANHRPSTLYMPGLIKVTDHHGRILDPVKCILEPRREVLPTPTRRGTGVTGDA